MSGRSQQRPSDRVPRLGLSPSEAAASLGISLDLFHAEVRPELRVVRLGRRIVVPTAELERFLDRQASRVLDDLG